MDRLRIIVGGYIGLLPAGGVTWDYIQYPIGFAACGHDVYYIEDTRLWSIYQVDGSDWGDCTPNVAHLENVMDAFGLSDRWAYRDEASGRCFGLSEKRVQEICRTADLFVNISCSTFMRDEYRRIPRRALIDSDPMFTQVQYLSQQMFTPGEPALRAAIDAHTHLFTFGENIGADDCLMPDCGIKWRPTRQPIALDRWTPDPAPRREDAAYTTLMNWSAAPLLKYDGETWGQKNITFESFINIPRLVPEILLAVAVGQTGGAGSAFPANEAREHGWRVLDPKTCAHDWRAYRDFIDASRGEFSIAKETYVKARTGWFSCRSACYLAAGRAVVTQDTGWSKHLPHDRGLLAFDDTESAVEALRRVEFEPEKHARAARQIAEDYFDSRKVLAAMIAECESAA